MLLLLFMFWIFGPKAYGISAAQPGTEPAPYAAAAAESLHSCPFLCDPIAGSPPGSPVPGTLQVQLAGTHASVVS